MSNSLHTEDNDAVLFSDKTVHFPHPEKLKRSELDGLDISLWDELCLTVAEEGADMLPPEYAELLNDEEFTRQVAQYQSLKVESDESVVFPDKGLLKRKSYRIGVWVSVAAAAAIIALFMLPYLLSENTKLPKQSQPLATNTNTHLPQATRQPNTADVKPEKDTTENRSSGQAASSNKQASKATTNNGVKEATDPVATRTVGLASLYQHPISVKPIEQAEQQPVVAVTVESIALAPTPAFEAPLISIVPANEDKSLLQALAQRVAGKEAVQQVVEGAEHPGAINRLAEKSIIGFNRLLDKETIVVKEYDSNGKLTLYAVQSGTISFQKTYTE